MWNRNYFSKMKGEGENPLTVYTKDLIVAFIGALITIIVLIYLTKELHSQMMIASFGGSCALAFGLWQAPVSQPRSIFVGHVLSTFIALVIVHTIGDTPLLVGVAVALSITAMMMTRTMHPPAAANPIVVMLEGHTSWEFLLFPIATGACVVILLALIVNNLSRSRRYPTYW